MGKPLKPALKNSCPGTAPLLHCRHLVVPRSLILADLALGRSLSSSNKSNTFKRSQLFFQDLLQLRNLRPPRP